tara:strand:+ start:2381 stop:3322 length:942 start_codon:yes stop_codon:yes gene_type:complete
MNIIPWTEKYRPETSKEVCGNSLEFEQVLEYGRQSKNLLLHGPSGTGKSSAVKVLLKNVPKDSKLILDAKCRASETTQHLLHKLTVFTMRKTTALERFVLVDEVDSIRINDQKMFVRPLTKDVGAKENKRIIFLFICNVKEKVSEFILNNCVVINYNSLQFSQVSDYLEKICLKEHIKYNIDSLEKIFYHVGRDMRKTVSMMQYLTLLTEKIDYNDLDTMDVSKKFSSYELLDKIFSEEDIEKSVNIVYGESLSITMLCIYTLKYHKNLKLLTNEYIKVLAHMCHDTLTTEDTWFLIYRIIYESPKRKKSFGY